MKMTIIPSDKFISVDDAGYSELDMPGIPGNVHALQWNGTEGEIEYNNGDPNETISELPAWANAAKGVKDAKDAEIAAAQAAEQAEYNKPENVEARRKDAIRTERDNRLDALSAATGRRNTTLQALGLAILSKKIKNTPLTPKEEAMEAQLEAMSAKVDAIDEAAEQAIANGTPLESIVWPA